MPELTVLFETDPTKLFEKYSVEEVENIYKKVNGEIERKREELRTLVGARYRDLIEAADSIKEMKNLSSEIICDIKDISTEMAALHKKQASSRVDFLVKDVHVTPSLDDCVAAELGILLDLPELIWSALSRKDYVNAAQLYLLGRHIKTGFSVDKELIARAQILPFLSTQWTALSQFSQTILNRAEEDIKTIDIDVHTAASCLATVALLQNTPIEKRLLSLRTQALDSILFCDSDVKRRILDSSECISNTMNLLQGCFIESWEHGRGLVWRDLHYSALNKSPINLLEDNIRNSYLPSIITNFKVTPLRSFDSVEIDRLPSSIEEWLREVKTLVFSKGKDLLNNIKSLQGLNSLKQDYSYSDVEWNQLLKTLNVPNKYSLWDEIYNPLLTSRAKELITSQCDETFEDLVENMNVALCEEDMKRSDLDLRWYVWKESADDLDTTGADGKTVNKGIFLKSKGITPKVAHICQAFDTKLAQLYSDLSALYSAEDMLNSDCQELKIHQQVMCSDMTLRLKEHVRKLVNVDEVSESKLSVIARLLQSVPDLCPMLQKCLTLGETKGNVWHEAKLLLNSESMFCWSLWEEKILSRFKRKILETLKKPTTYADLLNVIPQWEVTWIEEGGDEQPAQRSELRVPCVPSLSLQVILQHMSTELSRAHLPRLISENVIQKSLPIIFGCYKSTEFLCQAEALQTLFDIKYLSSLYIPITSKDLKAIYADKVTQIESFIDPIDLEVFSPLIQTNVTSSVQRSQGMFGSVFASDESAPALKMTDDPSVLALSKFASNVWFPSLPLTNPSNRPLHIIKPKAVKLAKPGNESDVMKTSGGSSSFFSDWFVNF